MDDNDRTLALVEGIDPNTPIPPEVAKYGLKYRAAIVLDSYRRNEEGMFFDSELFLAILRATCSDILGVPTLIEVYVEPGAKSTLRSVEALERYYEALPEEDREIPDRIEWRTEDIVSAVGYSERWDQVGGPSPYHDSYTFSIFSRTPIFPSVQVAAEAQAIAPRGESHRNTRGKGYAEQSTAADFQHAARVENALSRHVRRQ